VVLRPVARLAAACDVGGMSSDRPSIPPDSRMQFVVVADEHGTPKLDVREASLEQTYRVGDRQSVTLFLALSRSRGLLPYRHPRQHEGTICVRATLAEHDALWSTFLKLDRSLGEHLAQVTLAFVRQHVEPKPR
jgi:hypothetical protein